MFSGQYTLAFDSFCDAISKHLLGRLGGRDIIGGEDPFTQGKRQFYLLILGGHLQIVTAVLDALALCRRLGLTV